MTCKFLSGERYMYNKILLAVLIFFAVPFTACEARGDSAPIGVQEAVSLTLENNSYLRQLKQELIKADAFRIQADGTMLPTVTVNLSAAKQKELQTSDGSDRTDSRTAKAGIEQTLYSGGKNSALRRQSGQVRTIAELALQNGENGAVGELFGRFYNVLLQGERIKAEEAAVNRSNLHLREVKKMNELGLANRLEVIRAAQTLASNTADLSTARGKFEAANISLMNYMAIPPERKRPVSGDLLSEEAKGDREESLKYAAEFRADFKKLKEQLGYQKNQITIEKSSSLPKITLGAYGGVNNPYGNRDESDDTWKAELSLTVPIFDRNVSRGNVLKAKAALEQNRLELEQKEIDIKSEVETAWTEIESAKQRLTASSKALEFAAESLRLAEVGYREGVSPQLDLLAAQSMFTTAMLDHASAKYNHLMALVALKMTEGTIIEWSRGIK